MSPRAVEGSGRWAGGGLEYLGRCPVCSSADRHPEHMALKDWSFHCSDDEWTLWCCENCRTLYLDPRPDSVSLGYAYRNYYTHESDTETPPAGLLSRLAWANINGYLNRRFGLHRHPTWSAGYWLFLFLPPLRLKLDYFGRHLPRAATGHPAPRLLDAGCGSGIFLQHARDMGWSASGVELDPEAVKVCRARGLQVYEGAIDSVPRGERYDAITVSHTLEHLPDPQAFASRCRELLAESGFLWIAIPNPESLGHKLFGSAWRGLETPRHLCLFPAAALMDLLRRAGYRDVRLLRRGAHSPRIFRESAAIAAAVGRPRWSRFRVLLLRLLIDIAATFSSRRGEELVVVARR